MPFRAEEEEAVDQKQSSAVLVVMLYSVIDLVSQRFEVVRFQKA